MSPAADMVLPYRVEGQDLEKMLEHRARGRSMDQIRTLGFSNKGFEGTRRAAEALGFLDQEGEVTELGKKFARARDAGARQRMVLQRMMQFEPYGLLLTSLLDDGTPAKTELDEVEIWWATHDFGNSESNRERGSTAFGRLVDYVGLGKYILGRGGHPSRIEWESDADRMAAEHDPALEPEPTEVDADAGEPDDYLLKKASTEKEGEDRPALTAPAASQGEFAVQVPLTSLSSGRAARVIVPQDLTREEKERLIEALEFLLMVDDEGASRDSSPSTSEEEGDEAMA